MAVPIEERTAFTKRVEADISRQLASKKKRLAHSFRVADTCVELARIYGVDEFDARVAGLLHDYAKAYSKEDQLERAKALGLDFGVELEKVLPILHGPIAARELPLLYPELDAPIFQAIERHTVASDDMSPLDMVLFIADGIEPGRPDAPAIARQRAAVGVESLEDVFFACFHGSISYVLVTERYLWPRTIETYNHLVTDRSHRKELHGIHSA